MPDSGICSFGAGDGLIKFARAGGGLIKFARAGGGRMRFIRAGDRTRFTFSSSKKIKVRLGQALAGGAHSRRI